MSALRPSFIEDIRRQVQATTAEQRHRAAERYQLRKNPNNNLFHIKSADQWLGDEHGSKTARQLLGNLWYENELCVLFADTNLGKSILAVQVGYCIAKNDHMEPFANQVGEAVTVLYIDFELSAGQFKLRYTDRFNTHHFGDNFIRAEFNPSGENPILYDNYATHVRDEIADAIVQTKAKVLIIDNITSLGSPTNSTGSAFQLMKELKLLKTKHKLSILVLAHTPKRNLHDPITVNDLQGSKMLINFADSAFAIGQSQLDPSIRYVKQIKQRNSGNLYGTENVCLFRIGKQQSFLCFDFLGYDNERLHLQKTGIGFGSEITDKVIELNRQGLSVRQIAANLKISSSAVGRVIKKLKDETVNEAATAYGQ